MSEQWPGTVEISQPLKAKQGEVGLSNSQNVAHKLDPGIQACRQQGHPLCFALCSESRNGRYSDRARRDLTPREGGIRPAVGGVMLVAQVRECVDLIFRWWHVTSRFVHDLS